MEWRRRPLALVTALVGVAAVVTVAGGTDQEPAAVAAPRITESADQNVAEGYWMLLIVYIRMSLP